MKRIILFAFAALFVNVSFATTYYSVATSNISNALTTAWNSNRLGGGSTPANFANSGDIFIVQGTGNGGTSPHTMTSSSTITFGAGVTVEVEGGATLIQTSTITFNGTATFKLDANSFYTHNSSSSAATVAGIESWDASATIRYTNTGFLPTASITGGAHPNVIIANASNANIAGVITSIAGNLTILAGASNTIQLTGSAALSLSIGGSLILTTGTALSLGNGTATPIINIAGNLSIATGMTLTYAGSGAQGSINFTKSGTQIFSTTGTGVTSGKINYTVNNGSTLDVGTSVIAGTGTFTLSSGAGIITANTNATGALTTSGANGSIQVTGTRTYNSGANYTFNGASAQNTGNGLTGANNVTINNSAGVTLTSATTVTGTLSLTNGVLSLGANNLTLTGATVTGASSSNYLATNSTGKILRSITSGGGIFVFPIGRNTSNYTPLTITNTGGATSIYTVGAATTTYTTPADGANAQWSIASGTSTTSTFAFEWLKADAGANLNTTPSGGVVYSYNGSTWGTTGGTTTGTPNVTTQAGITSANTIWTVAKPAAVASIAISASSPAAGNIVANTTNNILQSTQLVVTTANASLTGVTVNTTGSDTYTASSATDLTNFKLWINTANNLTGATQLGSTITNAPTHGGALAFTTGSNLPYAVTTATGTYYLLLTCDVVSGAVPGRVITMASTAFSNIAFAAGNLSGTDPVAAGNTQTIIKAPTVTTDAATAITTTSVTLNGTVNPNAGETLVSFQYGTTIVYGTEVDAVESPLAAGTGNQSVSKGLTSLPTNTLYHYRVLALNDADLVNGSDATFTTLSNAPVMDNATARTPTATGFTANWTAPSNGGSETYTYTVEVSTDNSSPTNFTTNIVGAATKTGIASGTLTTAITGLTSGTTYYYRVKAINASGSSDYSAISTSVVTASANIALADNSQVSTANVLVGTNNHILSRFSLTNSGSLDAALNTINFTTTGTYVAADISNLKLWYNTSNDFSTATPLAELTTSLGPAAKSFTGLTQNIAQGGSPVYCWITTNIAGAATTTKTIAISAIANAAVTFDAGSKSGSVTAGGTQTLVDGVDGVISTSPSNEYGDHNNGGNQETKDGVITYMRWTDDKLYVGVKGANIGQAFVLYLDKAPQVPVNGGTNANGTNVGNNYDGTNFAELPFRSDLVLYVKSGYREYRTANGINGWSVETSGFGEYAENGGTDTREFSIPWSVIGGKPTAFNWFGYIVDGGANVYGQTPTENSGGTIGTSARYGRYYTVSNTSSTKPFSQNSYVFNSTSDLTGFGGISVYDFTMNTNGRFISRSNSASGAWNIAGNLVVNNGTIYMGGSGGGGYGATTVTGDLVVSGGLLDVDYNTNPLTVTGNVTLSGGTLALGNSFGGDLKLKGNWTKTGGTLTNRTRLVEFNGTTAQTLTGSTTFDYFKVDNTSGLTLVAANPTTVNTNITLTTGSKLTIGSSDLVFGGVNADLGTGSTNYIVTNSSGQFKRTVGVTATNFPVGNSNYNPLTITNSGTSDIYGIRVEDGAITATSPNAITKTINRLWKITEANAGGSTLTIAATYNNAEKNNATNFDAATTPRIGLYNGSTWSQVDATTVTNTFTASSTLTPTDLTTAQSIALGKDDGFIAFPPEIVLADNGTQVAVANIGKNTTNNIIYKLQLGVTVNDATVNSVAFTTTGTYVASSDITNFKLYYSTTNDFSAATLKSTLSSSLDAGAHSFTSLSQSITATTTGYFWITTDIKAGAIINNTIAVSAITTSDITVVLGNKTGTPTAGGAQTIKQFTTASDAFRTAITGNWNDIATWESFSGGSWIAATLTPDASASTITILNGDEVTIPNAVSITADDITVDAGGQITIASGGTLVVNNGAASPDITVNGYLKNTGTLTLTGTGTVSGSSATYEHNINDINPPAFTWASNATLKLTGTYTGAGTAMLTAGAYQNIIYQGTISSSTDYVSFGDNAITIAGKLTVSGSGSGALLTSAGGTSPTVAEYEQTSGIVFINRNSGSTRSLTVTGNATITGGILHIKTLAGAGAGQLFIGGNLDVGASGTLTNSATTSTTSLQFNGSSPQTWSNVGAFSGTTIGIGVSVTGTGGVTLNDNITLPFASSLTLTSGDFTVASGKTLTFGGTSTASIAGGRTLTVDGILTRTSNGTFTTTGTLSFSIGGKYQHNHNAGTIPTATWNTGSICEITGMTTSAPSSGLGQSFYNFNWNCPNQTSAASLGGILTTILGDLNIIDCGSNNNDADGIPDDIRLNGNSNSSTLIVSGNLNIGTYGNLSIINSGSDGNGNGVLTVNGNITVEGKLDFTGSSANTATSSTLNLKGNLSIIGAGVIVRTRVTSATLNFIKSSGTQTFSSTANGINTHTITINIGDGATTTNTVQLSSNFPMSTSSTLTVKNGSALDCQTNVVSGGNSVTVNNGGTLKVGSINALGAIEDNVPISTLTLSSGSTVEFNGAAAQFAAARTFENLVINNTGGTTLLGDVIVNNNLDLQTDLSIGADNILTLNNATTSYGSGLLIGTSSSALDVTGSSSLTATFKSGGQQLLWLNVDKTSGSLILGSALTIADELSLVNGTSVLSDNAPYLITLNGDLTGTGSYTGSGKILFTGNAAASNVSGATLSNVEFDDDDNFELTGNTTITGLLTLTNGYVAIGSNTFNLSGTINNTSGLLRGSSTSNISITGTGSFGVLPFDQTTDGTTNILNNVIVNRTSSGTVSLGNKLVILNSYTPTAGVLTTAGFLHLRSTPSNTARIAAGTAPYITGDVTVERYAAASAKRAWRLLTPGVTTSTTINANWQEGKQNTVLNTNVAADVAGYGTHITGDVPGANGFDVTLNNSASLYTFDQAAQDWALVTNTNVNTLDAKKGYLLFVRGNRDIIDPINTTTGSSNVTLRATGTLLQGTQTFSNLASDIPGGDAEASLVTNPFASPISWASIYTGTNVTNFKNYFTVWDPTIGSRGGFVTVTNGGLVGNVASHLTTDIQSGQAFFLETKTGISDPSFVINESDKSTTNSLNVFRTGTQTEKLRIQLRYTSSSIDRSADGVTVLFGNAYSNGIDENDANQFANWDEDIALLRNGKELSIESRQLIDAADTLYLKIANLRAAQINYRWVLTPENFNAPGLEAFLIDAFTNTVTPISLTDNTTINFTVSSNTATTAANRFKIVFRNNAALPVTITNIKAQQKNNDVQVQWNTVNEQNIHSYEVEKSTNAIEFKKINTVLSNSTQQNNEYNVVDASIPTGTFYYRIKIVEKNGHSSYSKVVKISIGKGLNSNVVTVYPNPVKGNTIQLQWMNVEQGEYAIRLINTVGQVIHQSNYTHTGGSATTSIVLSKNIAAGKYQLEMLNKKGERITQTVIKE